MTTPTISAYVSAFNVHTNGLDWETGLRAALAFFDQVVIAANTSTDGTLAALQDVAVTEPRLKVVTTDYAYTDVEFDGKVKDAALQACDGEALVQLDLDEVVPLNQRALWRRYATELLALPNVDCFMFPSVDLWGSMDTLRADTRIGSKFRLHKRGLHRGVLPEAWLPGHKHFRTDMSDSCEALRADNTLARAAQVVPYHLCHPAMTQALNGWPFTVHRGYVSFDQRIRVNKAIWAKHWEARSGHPENVAVDKATLEGYPLIRHHLDLT